MLAISMEISIERQNDYNTYADVIIGDKLFLSTRVADNTRDGEQTLKEWINQIQKQHTKKNPNKSKSKTPDMIVGLCARHGHNCTKPPYPNYFDTLAKGRDDPYHLLQLCVGTHCILLRTVKEFGRNPRWVPVSDVLKDFLRCNTVVGVGIDKMAAKMEKDFEMVIPKRVELRDVLEERLSEFGGGLAGEKVRRLSLEQMSKVVLEGEVDVGERPKTIAWNQKNYWGLSDDLIKYSTVDAFLAHEMGKKLLRRI